MNKNYEQQKPNTIINNNKINLISSNNNNNNTQSNNILGIRILYCSSENENYPVKSLESYKKNNRGWQSEK
jgi:hypothetical protein